MRSTYANSFLQTITPTPQPVRTVTPVATKPPVTTPKPSPTVKATPMPTRAVTPTPSPIRPVSPPPKSGGSFVDTAIGGLKKGGEAVGRFFLNPAINVAQDVGTSIRSKMATPNIQKNIQTGNSIADQAGAAMRKGDYNTAQLLYKQSGNIFNQQQQEAQNVRSSFSPDVKQNNLVRAATAATSIATAADFGANPKAAVQGIVNNIKTAKNILTHPAEAAQAVKLAIKNPVASAKTLINADKTKPLFTPKAVPKTVTPIAPDTPAAKSAVTAAVQTATDPVKKIIVALNEEKPLRGALEKSYTQERGQRITQAGQAFEAAGGGQGGYAAKLSKLKGELADKPTFTPVSDSLKPEDINALHDRIHANPNLNDWERVTAGSGLEKLLKGNVPTEGELSLLKDTFGHDFVSAATKSRTRLAKIASTVVDAANLPRAIMSSFDLSAPLRQGVVLAPSHPKEFGRAFGSMFKYAFSPKAYEGLGQEIQSRPTYPLMRRAGLALTDTKGKLANQEEAFMSNLAQKIPVVGRFVKGSDRAYSGFLNKLRADTFDHLVANGQRLGKTDPNYIKSVASFVNNATGRGELPKIAQSASPLLNATFFSPRLMASRFNLLLNPKYYLSLDPTVRKEAVKSMAAFIGTGTSLLGLAKLGGADVSGDPRSADFGKIKIGDTRYDIWGGFQQEARLIAQLVSGQKVDSATGKVYEVGSGRNPTTRKDILENYFAQKLSPVPSFAYGYANQTKDKPFDVPKELLNRFTPIISQDLTQALQTRGVAGAAATTIPALFGVGTQTYGSAPLRSRYIPKQ